MKPTYVILYPGTAGGTATLSIRIGEQLVKEGHEVYFICQKISDENNVKTMRNIGIKLFCWKHDDVSKNLINMNIKEEFIFLTYRLSDFFNVESFKKKINIKKNILYVVHHYGLIRGKEQNLIFRTITKIIFRNLISKIIQSNNIIFMDALSVEETEKYYKLNIESRDSLIFNLPIKVRELDECIIDDKKRSGEFNILTISRAEFPFKGYILGLIDDFDIICKSHHHVKLTIITFGRDIEKVYKKLEELPNEVRNRLSIVGQTPYENLGEYFNKAHVLLGMGTTLLDAANYGVPSLVVQQYTYRNFSSGLFHTQPKELVGKPNIDISPIVYIEDIIKMNNFEYKELCIKEHNALLNFYNIDLLLRYLNNNKHENDLNIPRFTFVIYKIIEMILTLKIFLKSTHEER